MGRDQVPAPGPRRSSRHAVVGRGHVVVGGLVLALGISLALWLLLSQSSQSASLQAALSFLLNTAVFYPLRELLSTSLVTWSHSRRSPLTTLLYVSSYAGTITTLNLTQSPDGTTLTLVATSDGCSPNPSWLTLDSTNARLYCLDEGLDTLNGTLSSFEIQRSGALARLDKVETINGPVSAVVYGDGGRGLALAQYMGSSTSTFDISVPSSLRLVESQTFSMSHAGPNPSRQDAPHPHQVVLDPTGHYILVPDLGADLVRVFLVDNKTLRLTAVEPLAAAPGSGPRHVVFLVSGRTTYMYLIAELANTITVYHVTYGSSSLGFKEVDVYPTHGNGQSAPAGATAAEIVLSPDKKFLMASSRGEGVFSIANFDPQNSTKVPSDPLFSYLIDHETGKISLTGSYPAGGMIPRQFTMNRAGTLVGVGLQDDGRVAIIGRDPLTGELGGIIAHADVADRITSVFFHEPT